MRMASGRAGSRFCGGGGVMGLFFFDMAESVLWEAMMEFFGLDIHLCWIGMNEGMQSVWVHG